MRKSCLFWMLGGVVAVLLSACSGGGGSGTGYTISGTVSGLTGTGLVLLDNGGDDLVINTNGTFTFATPLATGTDYNVTVSSQPSAPAQICTVNNGSGVVSGVSVTNVSVSCTAVYTVSGTVSGLSGAGLVLQNNGGDDLAIGANGTFAFATPVASGANFNVSVLTHPSTPPRTCVVTGSAGTVAGANITNVMVDCVSRYAFVANFAANTVSSFTIDAASGLLVHTGQAATGVQPYSVAVDPTGKYVYVANMVNPGGSVSQYTVAADGSLTPMVPASVAAGANPMAVVVDPSGKYVYVANQASNTISIYTIGASGNLTPLVNPSAWAGGSPNAIAIDKSGQYAYVANMDGSVWQYTIGPDGFLTPMVPASVAAGLTPVAITVDPTGRYVYVANFGGTVSQYTIAAGGGLVPMAPATVPAPAAHGVTVDSTGSYVYVPNNNVSNTISQFMIGAGGTLTPMVPATVPTGSYPRALVLSPAGNYAYVPNAINSVGGNTISQFTIGGTGGLIPLSPATAAAAPAPISIAIP